MKNMFGSGNLTDPKVLGLTLTLFIDHRKKKQQIPDSKFPVKNLALQIF